MSYEQIHIKNRGEGSLIGCRVKTNARKTRLIGPYGDRIKISVREPAKKGKANRQLKKYLADLFRCRKEDITIISGQTSPDKKIQIHHRSPDQVRTLLEKQEDE